MTAPRTTELLDDDGHPDAPAIISTFWHRDGPHTAAQVAAAALAVDELTHYLARATWCRTSMPAGSDMCRIISELRSALGHLDQVFDQMSRHAGTLADDPTLYDDRHDGRDPADTAREMQGGLAAARLTLGPLVAATAAAHNTSSHLGHDHPRR